MALTPRRRFEILERDDFTCRYCGRQPPHVTLEVDHIQPRCHGGDDGLPNLCAACVDCNRGKAGRPLTLDDRAAQAKEEALFYRVEAVRDYWVLIFGDQSPLRWTFDHEVVQSFLVRGVLLSEIREAVYHTFFWAQRQPEPTPWKRLWDDFCERCELLVETIGAEVQT